MAVSSAISIELPGDFPTGAHNTFVQKLAPDEGGSPEIREELASGWCAVAIRFKTAADADKRFTHSITSPSGLASFEERQVQEEALFVFFVSGYAAIESLGYSLFALGALLRPDKFRMATDKERRAIKLSSTQRRLRAAFPGTDLETEFSRVVTSPDLLKWQTIRNILAHRSAPRRHHYLSVAEGAGNSVFENPKDRTEWGVAGGLLLDSETTRSRRIWLADALTSCIQGAASFVAQEVP